MTISDGQNHGGEMTGDERTPTDPASHFGQDGSRDTVSAGEAQRGGVLGTEQEQRLPAMSQNNANEIEKISGVMVQTRADVATMEPERVPEVLRERLEQAGIHLSDTDIEELSRQITTGDA